MFKKPLANLKSSTPLRSSDRRKLKQRVLAAYSLPAEDGDLLVPDGILTAKFTNHLDLQGVAYLSPLGDPLWISIGKGSDELIPTVYTLWKRPNILPFLCTPSPVIPVLIGGADLMIPGVMFSSVHLSEGQIVAICQYEKKDGVEMISAPLAVSRMAVSSAQIQEDNQKGKAALTIHTWKDHLWDIGSKHDAPAPTPIDNLHTTGAQEDIIESATPAEQYIEVAEAPIPETSILVYSKEEVSTLLRLSLLQAISTTLKALPVSSFPITLSTFYSTYILPSRPAFPALLVPSNSEPSPQDITIKGSTYKSVTAFIKAAEKETLLTTKALPKHTELVVTGVSAIHPAVQGHNSFATIGALEAKAAKKAEREEARREKEALAQQELEIRELWKPHQTTVELFQAMKASPSQPYTIPEIRNIVNSYVLSKDLINPHDKAYINLDDILRQCVLSKAPKTISKASAKNKNNEKAKELDDSLGSEFLKRDELFRRIIERMQNWYEVNGEVKKGLLLPIQISIKMRQGRKASTLTRGFEPFLIDAEEMADELRKTCAGATSVSPITGKGPNAGMEVLVQGKQAQAVTDYLTGKGVPKRWIEATGQ